MRLMLGPPESVDAEVLDEEPRNLLIALLSEIRIGMDLSRITLPTFILEPRSLLEKLTDFMTHGEILAEVPRMHHPYERIVGIVKWYLSGFYIKPQGVKKPYNPILGEFFRCRWNHEHTKSTTFYTAEQVSHHPPVSCVFFSNRKAGFVINGSVHPRSKFLGTSAASIMEGTAYLTIIPFDEEYSMSFPTVYGRGILFGTLLMEMCGLVTIECKKTHCKAEIDFKAKPFFGGSYNTVSVKIKHKKELLYTIGGTWDGRLDITNCKEKTSEVFWEPATVVRTPKIVRPVAEQEDFESQRLWSNVTAAIKKRDQREATSEKTKLEEAQRAGTKLRRENGQGDWVPKLFHLDENRHWVYRYIDTSKYREDEGEQEEEDGVIFLKKVGKEATMKAAQNTNGKDS